MTGMPKNFLRGSHERQRQQLRLFARAMLRAYGLEYASLKLLNYEDNAVYRVDPPDGPRFVLRLAIDADDSFEELRSQMIWLEALRRRSNIEILK